MVVDVTKDLDTKVDEVNMLNYTENMKMFYPRAEEEPIEFLNKFKIKDT